MTLPTITNLRSGARPIRVPSYLTGTNPVSDPLFDITPPVADMLTHPETDRPLSPVPPRIQRLDRHIKKIGQILYGKQAIVVVHGQIIAEDPLTRVSPECQQPSHKSFNTSNLSPEFPQPSHESFRNPFTRVSIPVTLSPESHENTNNPLTRVS